MKRSHLLRQESDRRAAYAILRLLLAESLLAYPLECLNRKNPILRDLKLETLT